jgi:hypothetical protein
MLDRRNATRVAPPKPISARLKTTLLARVVDISIRGLQVELPYALPIRARCDLRLQMEDGEVFLGAFVRRCAVHGWAERQGKKVLLYRAGLQFEASSREVLKVLGPKIPLLVEKAGPAEAPDLAPGGEETSKNIEMTIDMPGEE